MSTGPYDRYRRLVFKVRLVHLIFSDILLKSLTMLELSRFPEDWDDQLVDLYILG